MQQPVIDCSPTDYIYNHISQSISKLESVVFVELFRTTISYDIKMLMVEYLMSVDYKVLNDAAGEKVDVVIKDKLYTLNPSVTTMFNKCGGDFSKIEEIAIKNHKNKQWVLPSESEMLTTPYKEANSDKYEFMKVRVLNPSLEHLTKQHRPIRCGGQ